MKKTRNCQVFQVFRTFAVAVAAFGLVIAVNGCGSTHHAANFKSDFSPESNIKIEVGTVANETGQTFDVDISKMLADALTENLKKDNLLWTGDSDKRFILTSKILEYEKGSAFKRWLLPGAGSTVISINCELKESSSGKVIGSVEAKRSVSFGGGLTIGAWKTVFASVAEDVVSELRSKIQSKN